MFTLVTEGIDRHSSSEPRGGVQHIAPVALGACERLFEG